MKQSQLLTLLVVLSLFLVACQKTEVVKLDGTKDTATETPAEEEVEETPKAPVQTTNATGKVAVGCDDTDGDDIYTSGRVTITYDDGSKNDFVDECPVKNEFFQVEYTCLENNVKAKTSLCSTSPCIAGICIE